MMVEDRQHDNEQASKRKGHDNSETESLDLRLIDHAARRTIQQLLSKGKKANENHKKSKVKDRTAAFQEAAIARKRAKENVNNDQKSEDGPSATLSTLTLEKKLTSRRNTRNPGNEVKKWSHDEIVRIIDLYEERACLWDVFDKEYHNKDKPERALDELSRELDTPVADIKSKLLSLRSQLGRERAKESMTKSGQSLDDLYKPTWIYWEGLQFLQAVMQPGKSKDNIQSQGQEDKEQIPSNKRSFDSEKSSISVPRAGSSITIPRTTRKFLDAKKQELPTTCINVLKQPEQNTAKNTKVSPQCLDGNLREMDKFLWEI